MRKISPMTIAVFAVLVIFVATGCFVLFDDGGNQETTIVTTFTPTTATTTKHIETTTEFVLPDYYPEDLRTLYDKNVEARDFVLSYFAEKDKEHVIDLSEYEDSETVPHFLQWDVRWGYLDYGGECVGVAGCGPICLSMVGYHLTKDEETFAPDKVVNFALDYGYCIEDVGTAWALMDDGAEELGLSVESIYPGGEYTEEEMIESVENGNPLILIMGPGKFTSIGHFIVVHGYENGKFLVNDPNSNIRTAKAWSYEEFADEILDIWSYSCYW